MKNTTNRYNHKTSRSITPRQRQMFGRKIIKFVSLVALTVILTLLISGNYYKVKAADNYQKYYKSITINAGESLSEIYDTYGENFSSNKEFIKEVCMINDIEEDRITQGMSIIVPYFQSN